MPDHRALAAEAAEEAGANLAWPAPADPDRAIDDLEHDLASLQPLLDSRDPAAVKGRAHYLLGLNEALRRSVISRWARGRAAWSGSDGLVKSSPAIQLALDAQRLTHTAAIRLSALQRFATCPYQFVLATIYRLEPWDEPEPLVRMDPLTRGSLFHRAQAEFFRALKERARCPSRARRCRMRSPPSMPCSIAWPPSTPRRWRPRSSASGATKSTTCGATWASGCRSWRRKRSAAEYFEYNLSVYRILNQYVS